MFLECAPNCVARRGIRQRALNRWRSLSFESPWPSFQFGLWRWSDWNEGSRKRVTPHGNYQDLKDHMRSILQSRRRALSSNVIGPESHTPLASIPARAASKRAIVVISARLALGRQYRLVANVTFSTSGPRSFDVSYEPARAGDDNSLRTPTPHGHWSLGALLGVVEASCGR
jgi:hypothetical protein